MPDTKRGREEQARQRERRQQEREVQMARERGDEPEPPTEDDAGVDAESPTDAASAAGATCQRRGCDRPADFFVLERYLEETGHGAVEATAALCEVHTAEEAPTHLDDAYEGYVYRIESIPGTSTDGS